MLELVLGQSLTIYVRLSCVIVCSLSGQRVVASPFTIIASGVASTCHEINNVRVQILLNRRLLLLLL